LRGLTQFRRRSIEEGPQIPDYKPHRGHTAVDRLPGAGDGFEEQILFGDLNQH